MINSSNGHTMLYNYNNGFVTRIDEFNSSNAKVMDYEFVYNAIGKLIQVNWKKYSGAQAVVNERKQVLTYLPDGNLASLAQYYLNNGVLELTSTTEFSDYDDQVNVDDFYMLENFFDSFLFLPQVKLQQNN